MEEVARSTRVGSTSETLGFTLGKRFVFQVTMARAAPSRAHGRCRHHLWVLRHERIERRSATLDP
jgi:hypothetical protein